MNKNDNIKMNAVGTKYEDITWNNLTEGMIIISSPRAFRLHESSKFLNQLINYQLCKAQSVPRAYLAKQWSGGC
jgi:hypothetical protein